MTIPSPGAALFALLKLVSLVLLTPFILFAVIVFVATGAVLMARHTATDLRRRRVRR